MRIPIIRGMIDRRLLVNFRVEPAVLSALLSPPFKPKTVDGWGIAGICLIRLTDIRPRFVPKWVGVSSENAAHRIAVMWNDNGTQCEGVYVPRRDTNSSLNALIGGRLFPGAYDRARFDVEEDHDRFAVRVRGADGRSNIDVAARLADGLPAGSVFTSLMEASDFFKAGSLGYSDTGKPGTFDGMELCCAHWRVEPLAIEHVRSSFFDDRSRFPDGSIEFDCALLMRGIPHEWHGRPPLCPDAAVTEESCHAVHG